MIGQLPHTIRCDGKNIEIRTDYRIALRCLLAFQDPNLEDWEKLAVMRKLLIKEQENIEDIKTATLECFYFLNASREIDKHKPKSAKMYDWEQDEQMIFSGIAKIAGHDVRADEYMHWWTFLGYFNEIGESTFSQIVNIRYKRAHNIKLDKEELKFYSQNKEIINIKIKRSEEEMERLKKINELYS